MTIEEPAAATLCTVRLLARSTPVVGFTNPTTSPGLMNRAPLVAPETPPGEDTDTVVEAVGVAPARHWIPRPSLMIARPRCEVMSLIRPCISCSIAEANAFLAPSDAFITCAESTMRPY